MENTSWSNSKQVDKPMRNTLDFQALIDHKIEGFCKKNGDSNILQPVNYILNLGGKRVRPLLTLMAADLFSDEIEDAVYPAIAMEIFHNFTLMHDDIMDNAPLRRGHATVHEKWNRDVAILSGDAMLIQAYQLIIKTKPECLGAVMHIFNKTALEVCEGQQLDMDFQSRSIVTIDEYVEMIRLKTSVLLGGAMKIGATIAGASESDSESIYNFAIDLGLSFQLWDDYLDAFGDSSKTGKQTGGDILADKKTFLMIRALEKASGGEREILSQCASGTITGDQKITTTLEIFKSLGVDAELRSEVERYYNRALQHLECIQVVDERKMHIRQLALALHHRQF
jgi:geranylgeranyl diphosphate synthase type II